MSGQLCQNGERIAINRVAKVNAGVYDLWLTVSYFQTIYGLAG